MTIPDIARLFLYIAVAVIPAWIDFFTKSTDYTLRGLMMPILSSLLTAATVTLARTKSKTEPVQTDAK
jgi:hypothetical protein